MSKSLTHPNSQVGTDCIYYCHFEHLIVRLVVAIDIPQSVAVGITDLSNVGYSVTSRYKFS